MKDTDINSYKQRKRRGISVNDLIESLQVEKNEIDSLAVVFITTDKNIETYVSTDDSAAMLGAVEVAKMNLANEIFDYE